MIIPLMIAGQLLGQGLNSIFQARGQRDANRANERLAQQQNQWNIEQWERQNQYNDPAQQMARLQNAGINPRMIYNQGAASASGNAGDIKGYDRAEAKNTMEGFNAFDGIMNQYHQAVQTDNVRASTEVANEEKLLKAQQTLETGVRTANSSQDLKLKNALYEGSIEFQKGTIENLQKEIQRKTIDNTTAQGSQDSIIQKHAMDVKNAMQDLKGKQLQQELQKITNDMARNGISWSDNVLLRQLAKNGISLQGLGKSFMDKYGGQLYGAWNQFKK